jgi:hypothetical protein
LNSARVTMGSHPGWACVHCLTWWQDALEGNTWPRRHPVVPLSFTAYGSSVSRVNRLMEDDLYKCTGLQKGGG